MLSQWHCHTNAFGCNHAEANDWAQSIKYKLRRTAACSASKAAFHAMNASTCVAVTHTNHGAQVSNISNVELSQPSHAHRLQTWSCARAALCMGHGAVCTANFECASSWNLFLTSYSTRNGAAGLTNNIHLLAWAIGHASTLRFSAATGQR